MVTILSRTQCVNSLWPCDAIWQHRYGSTLAQVKTCCLTPPSHYLNQCWHIFSKVQWNAPEGPVSWYSDNTYSSKLLHWGNHIAWKQSYDFWNASRTQHVTLPDGRWSWACKNTSLTSGKRIWAHFSSIFYISRLKKKMHDFWKSGK